MTSPSIYHLHENDCDLIIPNLWLGNKYSALDENFIRSSNIKYVINVTDGIHSPFPFITYYHIPIKDKKMCDSQSREVMYTYIDTAINIILKGLQEKVLMLEQPKPEQTGQDKEKQEGFLKKLFNGKL